MSEIIAEPIPAESDQLVAEPTVFERDENGYVKGIVYPRRADGRIEWYKLIRPEHIVFNSKLDEKGVLEKVYGKRAADLNYGELIAQGVEVDPKHVLILLMGLLELADLRGYTAAIPRIAYCDLQICSVECTIDWIPNGEEPLGKTSYGTADATMENTNGWGYLSAMAGNRAFVRAVRQGLRIPILAADEIAKKDQQIIPETGSAPSTTSASPQNTLQKNAEAAKYTFEQVKSACVEKYREKIEGDPAQWKGWGDIAPRDCLTLLKLLKGKVKK